MGKPWRAWVSAWHGAWSGAWHNKILHHINTVLSPIKVNSNTIEPIMHTSCYCVLDLHCVIEMVLNFSLVRSEVLS